jgi:UDP-glucose 4-epimerase
MAKAVVTGGAGFIGAHLVARLVQRGDQVVVLDNMKRGRRERIEDELRAGGARLVEGDIRSFDSLAAVVSGCDVVYHLAAQSNVMGAVDDPEYSITTNVLGTFNVLRSAAEAHVPKVVFTSSREVYGDPLWLPVGEDHPLLAKNPYGASKVAGEAYCRTFAATHGLRVDVVRLANVYGPGDTGRVIPLWLTAAQEGRDLEVYGGEQVIDFLWVGTAVDALIAAADRGLPDFTNIGSGVGTKILELAQGVLDVTGSKSKIARTAARVIEVAKFVADTERMRAWGLVPEADPLQHLAEMAPAYAPGPLGAGGVALPERPGRNT